MCVNSCNGSISNQINNSYADNKVNKLYQQHRSIKFFLGREASIVDKIKCWVVNTTPCFAPKSWKQQLIQQTDIIRYRTTNRSKFLVYKVAVSGDYNQPTISVTDKLWHAFKNCFSSKKEKNNTPEYSMVNCYALCMLYENTGFGKDKFCSADTTDKLLKYCEQHKYVFFRDPDADKPDYTRLSFNPNNFRNILTDIVDKVAKQEDNFKVSCRFNIALQWVKQEVHPMVLRFIKKQDSVVISLYDPINAIDTVRFIVKNKDAISQLQYKDFFHTIFQRAIYQLNFNGNRISLRTKDLDKLNLTSTWAKPCIVDEDI